MKSLLIRSLCFALLSAVLPMTASAQTKPAAPAKLRMYVFNNGEINGLAPEEFNFKAGEIKSSDFIVTSELIVHPTKGVLLWESGAEPDSVMPKDGSPFKQGPTIVYKSLGAQMASIGYSYKDVQYFAMSHLHSDHAGNANALVKAKWIVQKADRDMMFSGKTVRVMRPELFIDLKNADTKLLNNEDYDVFGDGSVRLISSPGHTPGHQVLLVNLASGPILLGGDLYHLPEEITTGKTPTFEFDPAQSAVSRAKVQELLKKTGAKLWIGHDKATHASVKFAPQYYE